jgi:predicted short-subunit dehydrogenase-like oxidoreductase (DUF2520 family)
MMRAKIDISTFAAMQKIVLVGAGRVATHLGRRLQRKGIRISQVISRTAERAELLANQLACPWTDDFTKVMPDADWLLMCVRDDVIDDVSEDLSRFAPKALATHTSGATPGAIFGPYFERHGVFYPLQTFTEDRQPTWSRIPFCITANHPDDMAMLMRTARVVGKHVYEVTDAQRSMLHVGAVFANNFANHCLAIAEQLMREANLPFEMLHPLMEETLAKAKLSAPTAIQTGPAIRGDADTMARHQALLAAHPAWQHLYQIMSESIGHLSKPQPPEH